MSKQSRQTVYHMIERAIVLIESRVPEQSAVDVALIQYLNSSMNQPNEEDMAVFRSALQQALRGVWGLSAVVQADRSLAAREGDGLSGSDPATGAVS